MPYEANELTLILDLSGKRNSDVDHQTPKRVCCVGIEDWLNQAQAFNSAPSWPWPAPHQDRQGNRY